jgi:ABC-2 type transport system ATP-binding protein
MPNAVEVVGLSRSYRDVRALDRVSFSIEQGSCTALLGPNGAGKTTAVEILEGYRRRDAGDVRVLGQDPVHADRTWRQRVGIVPQDCADLLELSVHECVGHFASHYPRPRGTDEVIELVGLVDKASARISQLSGGQRRRLDVALGIIGDPELLFLDEPTTGFDPEARRSFWQLIGVLGQEGTTILLTTHYLEEADALADRVIVVNRGRVLADAPPASLGERAARRSTVRWREEGVNHEVATDTPAMTVAELHARLGGEPEGLEVRRPTLEDAYLSLIDEDGTS